MRFRCCDERRLKVVREHGTLNGIEFVEVIDRTAPTNSLRQRTLLVKLLRPVSTTSPAISAGNIRIDGGDRIKSVAVDWAMAANDSALPAIEQAMVVGMSELDQILVVRTAYFGDFSLYTLKLVSAPGDDTPHTAFDPRLASVSFSFKVECESDFDCQQPTTCADAPASLPPIDYLAKDYASFRRLLLDRISLLAPAWRERNPADFGVALIETLAYVGDQLSYQQDAIATEAYLHTARRRVSVRRHARLVDYRVHEGCNARAWVRVKVSADPVLVPAHTPVLTRVPGLPNRLQVGSVEWNGALRGGAEIFETTSDTVLYLAHEQLPFYTWGERACCLPQGATGATLRGHFPNLKAGDVLLLAEVVSPTTHTAADADPSHRGAVRLTHVRLSSDPSGGLFEQPPNSSATPVTEIEWDEDDALLFPLCLSIAEDETVQVSVAYGNIVLADHGLTVNDEDLGVVPLPRLRYATGAVAACEKPSRRWIPPRYRPHLQLGPVTHAIDFAPTILFESEADPIVIADIVNRNFSNAVEKWFTGRGIVLKGARIQGGDGVWSVSDGASVFIVRQTGATLAVFGRPSAATDAMASMPRNALPVVKLTGTRDASTLEWNPQLDLLNSGADAREFVVETETGGTAWLRFGDDAHGRFPDERTAFRAAYRIGNGVAGNVGAETIAHIASSDGRIVAVSNPLPAQGGTEPESLDMIRRDAPLTFRKQERAVTEADYARMAERHRRVQRAAGTFRWTGSWYTAFVTVDRLGGADVDAAFEDDMRDHLERYRMAGYDLEVDGPRFVGLELNLRVCLKPDFFRGHVKQKILAALGSGWRPDGRRAVFHPDNYTFAQPVYLSQIFAAVQEIEGVASVAADVFRRLREPDIHGLDSGVLEMGRLEIARLDNDPNFPERGVLQVSVGGGK